MPPKPLILAFDTSAAHCAAALLLGDAIIDHRIEPMHKGQAERLFPLLETLLSNNEKNWSDLDALGVCVGPGNFTGVRISVASARGLSLSLDIPAVGVSKLEAMAYGTKGRKTAILDARRDRVYTQSFHNSKTCGDAQLAFLEELTAHMSPADTLVMSNENLNLPNAMHLDDITPNVAHLAAQRYKTETTRPTPLYLRAADAALPSEPPVVILQ